MSGLDVRRTFLSFTCFIGTMNNFEIVQSNICGFHQVASIQQICELRRKWTRLACFNGFPLGKICLLCSIRRLKVPFSFQASAVTISRGSTRCTCGGFGLLWSLKSQTRVCMFHEAHKLTTRRIVTISRFHAASYAPSSSSNASAPAHLQKSLVSSMAS